jgi:hypothetical protein
LGRGRNGGGNMLTDFLAAQRHGGHRDCHEEKDSTQAPCP